METKTCTKCGRELPLSEFHRYNRRNETHYSQCRDCKADYKRKNKDKLLIAQYKRRRNLTDEDRQKRKAWNALHYILRKGGIIKPQVCEVCGSTENIQGHHKDYNKLFDVMWVCQKCHAELDDIRRVDLCKSQQCTEKCLSLTKRSSM